MTKKFFLWYLIFSIFFLSLTPATNGAFVPSGSPTTRIEDLKKIRAILEEKLVSQRLLDLGFTIEQVHQRISALTDEQIHTLAIQLRQLRAGGTGEGVLIGILIIVLVILVVLPLAGIRVWFDGKT